MILSLKIALKIIQIPEYNNKERATYVALSAIHYLFVSSLYSDLVSSHAS